MTYRRNLVVAGAIIATMVSGLSCRQHHSAQPAAAFELHKTHDSLYSLNEWQLPYPVYRFATGDVDADGNTDALVGVVKSTRFHPEVGRRLFVFKLVNGKVRPLWLGSKLGGELVDFNFTDGKIRSLEKTGPCAYMVAIYGWQGFGPSFEKFIVKDTDYQTALKYFSL